LHRVMQQAGLFADRLDDAADAITVEHYFAGVEMKARDRRIGERVLPGFARRVETDHQRAMCNFQHLAQTQLWLGFTDETLTWYDGLDDGATTARERAW